MDNTDKLPKYLEKEFENEEWSKPYTDMNELLSDLNLTDEEIPDFTEAEVDLICKVFEELVCGLWSIFIYDENESENEYEFNINELTLNVEEFKVLLSLLKKIFVQEDYQNLVEHELKPCINPDWEIE